jgi:FAD/FMN-containing dehydrogenase
VSVELDSEIAAVKLGDLRSRFRGALIRPGDEAYTETRRVWNGAIDRRPALIARCTDADDVVTALRFARERELPISVRGSGHSVAGHAVCDAGLMIDLSLMKGVSVDRTGRRARAAAGASWAEFDLATQRHGLATTGSTVSRVGVGGLALLGGFGHLLRRHGLAVDNLLAVDLITAEGKQLHVDTNSEPELLWGLRGGGGNFGIATGLTFDLHPVGPLVLGGPIYWPLEQAQQVLRFLRDLASVAPDDLGIMIVAQQAPPLPFLPPEAYGTPAFGLLVTWAGDLAEGMRVLAPLEQLGNPLGELVRPVPYRAIQTLLDGSAAPGNGALWRSVRISQLSDAAIEDFVSLAESLPTPLSFLTGWMIGGAASRVASDATALGQREVGFELRLIAMWPPEDPDGAEHIAWAHQGWERLRVHGNGRAYPTFLSDEGVVGVQAAYQDGWSRLVGLKNRYDPTNVFRLNVNIPPSQSGSE